MSYNPVILCIMDGWGLAPASDSNAVTSAKTPHYDRFMANYPNACLQASGPAVGLPEGQPGNSEVGHMNIGAGRCVLQDLPRIHNAIADNSLADHQELAAFVAKLRATGGRAHLLGLFSNGGVHAHSAHIAAIANMISQQGIEVVLHAFTDGRDTLPKIANDLWAPFCASLEKPVCLGSVIGRYYAMDRDNRTERTTAASDAIISGTAHYHADTYEQAIASAYERGESDEFIQATTINAYQGLQEGDGIFMANFRVDRARQILQALLDQGPSSLCYLTMTPVFSGAPKLPYLFGPQDLSDGLGEVVAANGLRQLRLAETEKYPHVTYFFNGGEEACFEAEDRTVITSPKVATYDLAPEMSAQGILETALTSIKTQAHELVIINFANPDMVGHTGDILAARKAVEMVDRCIGSLCHAIEAVGGAMIITADHGNCDVMWDADANSPHTAHTTNLVPVILVGGPENSTISNGCLADLAPSLLALLGLEKPEAMTGKNLLGVA